LLYYLPCLPGLIQFIFGKDPMKYTPILASLLIAAPCLQTYAEQPLSENIQPEKSIQLETVKVSADFRQLDLQQLPSAITVVGAEAIKNRNADHLESILSLAPNVNFSSGSSRGRYFQIRGIGERSQFVDPVNPSVGLFIDGIDMTGLGGAATLFDIEQVEVLRGPQGTAFGANALAGAINIKSNQPNKETEAYIETKSGNYNTQGLGGAISGSITDNAQLRVAINALKSDGYINNIHLDKKDTNSFDETVARAQLAWQINDNNDLNISIFKADIDNGFDGFSLNNTRTTYSDEPGRDTQKSLSAAAKWINLNSKMFIVETTLSKTNTDTIYSYDEDWSFDGIHPDGYIGEDEYLRDYQRDSLDIRLISNTSSQIFNGTTNWVAGINSWKRKEGLERNNLDTSNDLTSQSNSDSISVYTELTTHISSITSVTYGLRIEEWSIDYNNSNSIKDDLSETLWGGKITVDSLVSSNSTGYLTLAKGYKAGGVNSDPDISEDNRTFGTEINYTLELGLKSSLLNDSLLTRIATFYTQRKDQQVKSSYSFQNPDNTFEFQDYYSNAAEGKNYGIEFESNWKIQNSITWNLAVGYLKTKFTDYTFETDNGIIDKTGRKQAHAPEWSAATSIYLMLTNNLSLTFETEGKDAYYFSDSHDEKSKSYAIFNAKIEYAKDQFSISLNGRNLADKDYATRGFGFGNNPENGYSDTQHIQLGDPRLVTINTRYNF
jgi:iron complex outermembrane receptor protein